MKDTIKIRKAAKQDLPVLVSLTGKLRDYHRKLDPTYKTGAAFAPLASAYLKKDLASPNSHVMVVEDKGEPVGFSLSRVQEPVKTFVYPKTGYLFDIYLEPKYRRRRLARRILKMQFAWIKRRGARYVELFADARNGIGRRAWAKYGFSDLLVKMRRKI